MQYNIFLGNPVIFMELLAVKVTGMMWTWEFFFVKYKRKLICIALFDVTSGNFDSLMKIKFFYKDNIY